MDEASQICEPLALGPLLNSKKFIMIGDYYQLNPLVKSKLTKAKGFEISLFEQLAKKHYKKHVTVLKRQYRMNKEIMAISNKLTYKDIMICGSQQVANQVADFPNNVK